MVSGMTLPDGDPFLQRQNEPSGAVSTRNPLHLLAGANDYRTVDYPGLPGQDQIGDAWLGVFKSVDGGDRWTSTLLPGYPQDTSAAGLASPLRGYAAGADPIVRAGTNVIEPMLIRGTPIPGLTGIPLAQTQTIPQWIDGGRYVTLMEFTDAPHYQAIVVFGPSPRLTPPPPLPPSAAPMASPQRSKRDR